MNVFLVSIFLSILPVSELRGGMSYAILNGMHPILAFLICVIANILIIFFAFFFLDFLHHRFMKISFYRRVFGFYIEKTRRKVDRFEKDFSSCGFLALAIFVAIPLPATGAWTGCLIAWILGLDRRKSIASISLGVIVAGILILILNLGILGLLKLF